MGDQSGGIVTLNGCAVDFADEILRDAAGAEIPLRAQSFAVLRHLVENAGRTVSKDELNRAVWGGLAVKYFWSADPAGDIAVAEGLAREALSETNLSPLVERLGWWLHAFLLLKAGDVESALHEARRTVEMGPYDAWVLWALTDALLAAGESVQSAAWLERAAALDPRQQALHAQTRGYLLYRQERYDEALAEFARAGPLFGFNQAARAIALTRTGRTDEARAAIRGALADHPELSLTAWRATYGNLHPAILEAEIADLARAGLPE